MNSSRKLKFAALGVSVLLLLFASTWFGADLLVKSRLEASGLAWSKVERSGLSWRLAGVTHTAFSAERAQITLGTTPRAEFSKATVDLLALAQGQGVATALGEFPSDVYISADPLRIKWGERTLASGLRTRIDQDTLGARGPTMWVRGTMGAAPKLRTTGSLDFGGIRAELDLNFTLGDKLSVEGDITKLTLKDAALGAKPIQVKDNTVTLAGTLDKAAGTVSLGGVQGTSELDCPGENAKTCVASLTIENASVGKALQPFLTALPRLANAKFAKGTISLSLSANVAAASGRLNYSVTGLRASNVGTRFEDYETYFNFEAANSEGKASRFDSGPNSPDWVERDALPGFVTAALQTALGQHAAGPTRISLDSLSAQLDLSRTTAQAEESQLPCEHFVSSVAIRRHSSPFAEAMNAIIVGAGATSRLSTEFCSDLFVNTAEFAPGIYGIGPASAYYFDAAAQDLSLRQAAFLATLVSDPKVRHDLYYQQRQSAQAPIESVLRGMQERGFVSASQTANAIQARLHFE